MIRKQKVGCWWQWRLHQPRRHSNFFSEPKLFVNDCPTTPNDYFVGGTKLTFPIVLHFLNCGPFPSGRNKNGNKQQRERKSWPSTPPIFCVTSQPWDKMLTSKSDSQNHCFATWDAGSKVFQSLGQKTKVKKPNSHGKIIYKDKSSHHQFSFIFPNHLFHFLQ